jgi:hypothetical protein
VIEPQARSREGWFRSRILKRFAWEPPLARSLRAHAALLTQEGGPPAPTVFHQTRAVHSFHTFYDRPFLAVDLRRTSGGQLASHEP